MGTAKLEEFTVRDNRVARYAKALAHPARVAILRFLIAKPGCVCGDIVNELPLSQSTVSQHLKELKEAGLIKGDIEGSHVCYCIDAKEWAVAKRYLAELMNGFKEVDAGCCGPPTKRIGKKR
ncbi:MAG: winged helix-turn-helix transcriptional regulator [Flavobacteriales bacterium]|nr:winged helix-turn-helix transcriptional regulator [Flavobacteriales bacterium]